MNELSLRTIHIGGDCARTSLRLATAGFVALAVLGCTGADGTAGERGADGRPAVDGAPGTDGMDGSDGTNGTDGMSAPYGEIAGVARDHLGPLGNVPVILSAITDRGEVVGTLGATMTAADGSYSMTVDDDVQASSRLVVQVAGVPGDLLTLLGDDSAADIDPVTAAVAEAIVLVTESDGGKSLADYDPTEIVDLIATSRNQLPSGVDQADPAAMLQAVLDTVGGLVADYSGGAVAAPMAFSLPVPSDVPSATPTALPANMTYPPPFSFVQAEGNGAFNDGGFGCNRCFDLLVDGQAYVGQGIGTLEDEGTAGQELVFPAENIQGLMVSRRLQVAPDGIWIRFTDTIANPSSAPATVNVSLVGESAFFGQGTVMSTSDGNATVDPGDAWFVLGNGGPSGLGVWLGSNKSQLTVDTATDAMSWQYTGVVVPAQSEVTVIYWAGVLSDDNLASAASMLNAFPATSLSGVSPAAFTGNIGFSAPSFALESSAGSVAPFADITVTNTATSESTQLQALSDGAFSTPLIGASGQTITVTATDGTNETFVLP